MNNACLQVFQADLGLWMRKIGEKDGKEGALQFPAGLTTDRLNQIYCADYGTSKVTVFNKNGSVVRSFGGKGSAPGTFNIPRAVAVDSNDCIAAPRFFESPSASFRTYRHVAAQLRRPRQRARKIRRSLRLDD